MPARAPSAPPRPLPDLIDALRSDLRAARYTSDRAQELLGDMAADALRREQAIPALRALARAEDPCADLLALFTLGRTLPIARLEAALPSLGAAGAVALGLIEQTDAIQDAAGPSASTIRALVDLAPYAATDDLGDITWWIASDLSELATGQELAADHVLGVGGASLTLARITPRDRVGSVLDVGCGCGIQALHASRHADAVVATDLSERALAFAAFNAALNGIDLDLRHGSLLEPVRGERFDLIVSNPPFVITPRDAPMAEWTYRDGGRAGDALLAELLADLPACLAAGGRAVMLANWEIADGEPWDAHPRAWLADASANPSVPAAWVIQREQEDPAQYAETWSRDGGITDRDPRREAMITAWLDDFEARRVSAIGFGYILLAAPQNSPQDTPQNTPELTSALAPDTTSDTTSGNAPAITPEHAPEPAAPPSRDSPPAPLLICEEVTTTGSGGLGAHLAASLDAALALQALPDAALLASRPVRAADVIERRHLTPGAVDPLLIELVQGGGLGRTQRADQLLAATVGACDGALTLDQIIGAVCALTDEDPHEAKAVLLPAVRELIRTGMLALGEAPPA